MRINKYGITLILALCALLPARAQNAPQLKFRPDGSFKIVQFTDTHIRSQLAEQAAEVYTLMDNVLQAERPDLVVLTGDNVTCNPAAPEIQRLTRFLDKHAIPWVAVFGNHDEQQELTIPEMSALYAKGKLSLNRLAADGTLADLEIPIAGAGGAPAFYLFCMDSHAYSSALGHETYAWFSDAQIQWMKDCCAARTASDGSIAPALAFFHIPLLEYEEAWEDGQGRLGIHGEGVCHGALNSGMFAAMRLGGSVVGMSAGHDHNNDYIAILHGIALCYGRFSGSNTAYNNLPAGARVFVVREGVPGFETWIRENGGRVVFHTRFDGRTLQNAPRDKSKPFGIWSDFPTQP